MSAKSNVLALAGALFIAGTAIFLAAQSARGLTQIKGELCTQELDAAGVKQINIQTPVEYGLEIMPGDDNFNITLMYYNTLNECSMEKRDGVVHISPKNGKEKWYDYVRFDLIAPNRDDVVKLYLPPNLYTEISADVRYGGLELRAIKGDTLRISTDSGDVNISASDFEVYDIDTHSGDISLSGIGKRNDKGYAVLKTSTGKADIRSSKFNSLVVSNSYGDINIADTDSVVKADNRNGDIRVEGISGKILRFKNEHGNIGGSINGTRESYVTNVSSDHGRSNVEPHKKGTNLLEAYTSSGDIEFRFTQSDIGETYDESLEDILGYDEEIYYK